MIIVDEQEFLPLFDEMRPLEQKEFKQFYLRKELTNWVNLEFFTYVYDGKISAYLSSKNDETILALPLDECKKINILDKNKQTFEITTNAGLSMVCLSKAPFIVYRENDVSKKLLTQEPSIIQDVYDLMIVFDEILPQTDESKGYYELKHLLPTNLHLKLALSVPNRNVCLTLYHPDGSILSSVSFNECINIYSPDIDKKRITIESLNGFTQVDLLEPPYIEYKKRTFEERLPYEITP